MPADSRSTDLPPAQLHPDDDAAFTALCDELAAIAARADVARLAVLGLAASLDQHGDLERYAAVRRVADRCLNVSALLGSGVALLAVAHDLEQPVPLPGPDDVPAPVVPQPAPDGEVVTTRHNPGRRTDPPRLFGGLPADQLVDGDDDAR